MTQQLTTSEAYSILCRDALREPDWYEHWTTREGAESQWFVRAAYIPGHVSRDRWQPDDPADLEVWEVYRCDWDPDTDQPATVEVLDSGKLPIDVIQAVFRRAEAVWQQRTDDQDGE